MNLDKQFNNKLISKITETELQRYLNFFEKSYKENLEHAKFNIDKFPRWSIIFGYYAMHEITKLFLAKQFSIKIEFNVHKTTILIMKEIVKDEEILFLLKKGYEEFLNIANDLAEAREKRTKAQYYTGSEFMKDKYKEKADNFLKNLVIPYIEKLNKILIYGIKENEDDI